MITKKFDSLFDEFKNPNTVIDRKIKVKLKEIIACHEECTLEEKEFTNEIIDKFCELTKLIEERNEDDIKNLVFEYSTFSSKSTTSENFVAIPDEKMKYSSPEKLLDDFYDYFIETKTESTMKDYVARIRTFAYSGRYLAELLDSGVIGFKTVDIDPVLFTYKNIEIILARFNTKDSNGSSIKQRLNIRSALRMLNEFKKYKESC